MYRIDWVVRYALLLLYIVSLSGKDGRGDGMFGHGALAASLGDMGANHGKGIDFSPGDQQNSIHRAGRHHEKQQERQQNAEAVSICYIQEYGN